MIQNLSLKRFVHGPHTDEFNTVYVNDFKHDLELPDNYYLCYEDK